MGCDIHMFVEYKYKKSDHWKSFGGKFNPGRNYTMFGFLAGVRCDGVVYQPKGLPEGLSFSAHDYFFEYISDDDGDSCVSLKTAQEWYTKYGCKIIYQNDKPVYVQNPDWHTFSWLTTKEFRKVLRTYTKASGHPAVEYEAILSAMAKLEKYDMDVRIVFWFDN